MTIPTLPRLTSATSRWNPSRPAVVRPLRPWSSSTTAIRCGGHPKSRSRSFSARWLRALSVCWSTCLGLDWRRYTTAWRSRWAGRILVEPVMLHLLGEYPDDRFDDRPPLVRGLAGPDVLAAHGWHGGSSGRRG